MKKTGYVWHVVVLMLLSSFSLIQAQGVVKKQLPLIGGPYTAYLPMLEGPLLRPIIPSTTKPLDEPSLEALVSVTNEGATFTFDTPTTLLNSLQLGDVMVAGISPLTPFGFMRQVTNITRQGDLLVVTTAEANITQAVEQGQIKAHATLDFANTAGAQLLKQRAPEIPCTVDMRGMQQRLPQGSAVTLDPQYENLTLALNDVVLYDPSPAPGDEVKANGSINIQKDFDIDLQNVGYQITHFSFVYTKIETKSFEVTGGVSLSTGDLYELEILDHCFAPITFAIGVVPVVLVPRLEIEIGLSGEAGVTMTLGYTEANKTTVGAVYSNGEWSAVREELHDYDPGTTTFTEPQGNFSVEAYAAGRLSGMFYGVIGPRVTVKTYIAATGTQPLDEELTWKVHAGLKATADISAAFFPSNFSFQATIYDFKVLLAHSEEDPFNTWRQLGGSDSGGGVSDQEDFSIAPSLAIDNAGKVYVAWSTDINPSITVAHEIFVKYWDEESNSWVLLRDLDHPDPNYNNSVSFSPINSSVLPNIQIHPLTQQPYVAWSENAGVLGSRIYIKRWNPAQFLWEEVTAGSASTYGISNLNTDYNANGSPKMKFDALGNLYVFWVAGYATVEDKDIYGLRWNGSVWEQIGSNSASGQGISNTPVKSASPTIALDSNNLPYIAWTESVTEHEQIYIRRWDGSEWVEVGEGSASGNGVSSSNYKSTSPALVIDSEDNLSLFWHSQVFDGSLVVKKWQGDSWQNASIITDTTGGDVFIAADISDNDVIYVTWHQSQTIPLYILRWNNLNEAWEEVGNHSASEGGISPSTYAKFNLTMALNPAGVPYVAWDGPTSTSQPDQVFLRYADE